MSFLIGVAVGYGLAHVSAARWQWLESKLSSAWTRLRAGKKVP